MAYTWAFLGQGLLFIFSKCQGSLAIYYSGGHPKIVWQSTGGPIDISPSPGQNPWKSSVSLIKH